MGVLGGVLAVVTLQPPSKKDIITLSLSDSDAICSRYRSALKKQEQNQQLEEEVCTQYLQAVGYQPALSRQLHERFLQVVEEGAQIAREVRALRLERGE